MNGVKSGSIPVLYDVPQGVVMDPVLVFLYMSRNVRKHTFWHECLKKTQISKGIVKEEYLVIIMG